MDVGSLFDAGFSTTSSLVNSDGIEIKIGTKDKEDWYVHLPYNIVKKYTSFESGFTFYGISEEIFKAILKKYVHNCNV